MRGRASRIAAVCALACAAGVACSGGGGSGGGGGTGDGGTTASSAFPQGHLPVRRDAVAGGRGDVAFRTGGDLYVVDGSANVTAVAAANGAVTTFAQVDNGNAVLRSIAVAPDGRIYAGDDAGRVWATAAGGSAFTELVDTGSSAITGLAVVPTGFGDFGGSLVAAAGSAGILRVTTGESPAATTLVNPAELYVDVAFSGTTLFALDVTNDEIDTVSALGVRTTLAGTAGQFGNPVGMGIDTGRAEIWVADAGTDVLAALPVAGGAPSDRAPYDFDGTAPSGIAYDGLGTIAFVTRGSVVVRGSAVPRIDAASANFGPTLSGPTVGYGDLELDRDGAFVLVANDTVDPMGNFLFRVARDGAPTTLLNSNIGGAGEELLSLAIDPATQAIYIGTDLGNVYRRSSDGTVSLLVAAAADALLDLELAPANGFGSFGGHLIAATSAGELFAIDPLAPNPPTQIVPSVTLTLANGLVFASDGTLYVLAEDGSATPRLYTIAADGTATQLSTGSGKLGRPDGIEIDEGGERLLVTSDFNAGDQLLEVLLSNAQVNELVGIDIDEGFNPSGIVYDRLGTAIVRSGGNTATSLDAVAIFP